MPNYETATGVLHYQSQTALVDEKGRISLLAIDVPPTGHIQSKDIAAAYNQLRRYYGYQDGDTITVEGFRDQLGARPLFLISRVV